MDALRPLLHPALLAALDKPQPPSPADLWRLIETPHAPHPVYTIRLFSRQGAERLAAELDHAHEASTALDVLPTNNASEGRSGRLPSDGPPSLLLDEIGLQAVAHALASAVLAPLSRLLYWEWTQGGQLDSYHAFTIHRRAAAADQSNWFRPSSNSEGGGGGEGGQGLGGNGTSVPAARAGVHSDVCEVSLNVALRTSDDLVGSRVGFEPGCCGVEPNATGVAWLGHEAGTAFLNLCQQRHGVDPLVQGRRDTLVVRGFASKFRRAPAEGWYKQCIRDGEGSPLAKDEV